MFMHVVMTAWENNEIIIFLLHNWNLEKKLKDKPEQQAPLSIDVFTE